MAYTGKQTNSVNTNTNPLIPLETVIGSVGMPAFSIINGALASQITASADATYALAHSFANNSIGGIFYIGFTGTNRNHTMTFSCDARLADPTSSLVIINNNSYAGQDVFSNLRIVQQNAGNDQYILIDVANRNGSNGPLTIVWYGNNAYAPILAPASPGANTAVSTYGMFLDTSGNYTQLQGTYNLSGPSSKLLVNAGTPSSASIGTSGAMTAGTVTVNTTSVTVNSLFFFATHTLGTVTVPSAYYVNRASIVAGTSFVITSNQVTDTSTVDYWIIN